MKRGFGWFFVISSIFIIIRGILMISAGMDGSGILAVGILSVTLGTWMIDTSKPKEKRSLGNSSESVVTENNDDLKIKETNQQDTCAISKPINVPKSSIEEDSIDTSDIDKETIALATMFSYKIEMEFEDTIEDALKSTTKSDPVIQGMAIYSSIALTSKHLKNTDFSEFTKQSGIAKNELDAIIDRVASKTQDKYLISKEMLKNQKQYHVIEKERKSSTWSSHRDTDDSTHILKTVSAYVNNWVNGYRKIAKIRNCAPTNKTDDIEIVSIYTKVVEAFNEASRKRGEHIPAKYLNTIVLKFLQIYEIGGSTMLDEHLEYEIDKYIKEGLREDYKVDLQIF